MMTTNRRLLLLSNGSQIIGENASEDAREILKEFLGTSVRHLLFVPFAAVMFSEDEYLVRVRTCFHPMGYHVESIHRMRDVSRAVEEADAIVIGGGNTFNLLRRLHRYGLIEVIRERVLSGTPYIGWSAGSNVACPTIRTTNDMPIVESPTLDALGLISFQINPHYTDARIEGHMGETRDERLLEFTHANPGVQVVGLREGTMLRIEGDEITVLGGRSARVFINDEHPRDTFEITEPDSYSPPV